MGPAKAMRGPPEACWQACMHLTPPPPAAHKGVLSAARRAPTLPHYASYAPPTSTARCTSCGVEHRRPQQVNPLPTTPDPVHL
jgi:hypothetical protein